MLRVFILAFSALSIVNMPIYVCARSGEESDRKQCAMDLATINQQRMESFVNSWPVKQDFSKEEGIWYWYDANGTAVAYLPKRNSKGERTTPLSHGAQFVQGASDFRYIVVYRKGKVVGTAGFVPDKDGNWELLYSNWQEHPPK